MHREGEGNLSVSWWNNAHASVITCEITPLAVPSVGVPLSRRTPQHITWRITRRITCGGTNLSFPEVLLIPPAVVPLPVPPGSPHLAVLAAPPGLERLGPFVSPLRVTTTRVGG